MAMVVVFVDEAEDLKKRKRKIIDTGERKIVVKGGAVIQEGEKYIPFPELFDLSLGSDFSVRLKLERRKITTRNTLRTRRVVRLVGNKKYTFNFLRFMDFAKKNLDKIRLDDPELEELFKNFLKQGKYLKINEVREDEEKKYVRGIVIEYKRGVGVYGYPVLLTVVKNGRSENNQTAPVR